MQRLRRQLFLEKGEAALAAGDRGQAAIDDAAAHEQAARHSMRSCSHALLTAGQALNDLDCPPQRLPSQRGVERRT